MSYWIVKPVISGFEMCLLMYGSEASLRSYLNEQFKCPISYANTNYDVVSHLEKIGFKIYMLPTIVEDTKTNSEEN